MPNILTDPESAQNGTFMETITFDKWFNIINPLENNVISRFNIATLSQGDTLLVEFGLYNEFPAVIQEQVTQRTFYFSGDFALQIFHCGHPVSPVWKSLKEFSFQINRTTQRDFSGFIINH